MTGEEYGEAPVRERRSHRLKGPSGNARPKSSRESAVEPGPVVWQAASVVGCKAAPFIGRWSAARRLSRSPKKGGTAGAIARVLLLRTRVFVLHD